MSQICCNVHQLVNEKPHFEYPYETGDIPPNGIYILFETGEFAHGVERIVRVGTHTGKDKLPSRLREHFITENKDRSIFRKNIGRSILNRDNDPFLEQWNIDLTSKAAKEKYKWQIDFQKLGEVEKQVTEYIQGNIRFVVCAVDNEKERSDWEKKIITTVAQCECCVPSAGWLGRHSPEAKIRESGLWQLQHLGGDILDENNFDALKTACLNTKP